MWMLQKISHLALEWERREDSEGKSREERRKALLGLGVGEGTGSGRRGSNVIPVCFEVKGRQAMLSRKAGVGSEPAEPACWLSCLRRMLVRILTRGGSLCRGLWAWNWLILLPENWRDSNKSLNGMFLFFNLIEMNACYRKCGKCRKLERKQ